jgi:hypothetical protein
MHSDTFFCREEIQLADLTRALAVVETDKSQRPLKRTLTLFNREYRATWSYSNEFFGPETAIDMLELETLAFPLQAPFPVSVTIRFDDKVVWNRSFSQANIGVMIFPPHPRQRGTIHPGLSIKIENAQLPSLFGTSRGQLIATSATGAELVKKEFRVPDWKSLAEKAAAAFQTIEHQRKEGRCKPDSWIIVV